MAEEILEAPMVGKVIEVSVSVGAKVEEGDVICILESMKMENPLVAPVAGVVKDIKVSAGQAIKGGDTVAIIEY